MLSHRAHTETLSLQEEANSLRTQANIYHTRASDQWAFYQAKNIRSVEYQGFLGLLKVLPKPSGGDDRKSAELAQEWSREGRALRRDGVAGAQVGGRKAGEPGARD